MLNEYQHQFWWIFLGVVMMSLLFGALAFAYSDNAIADAIFKAEGGLSAQFYYGIRSVKYKDIAEARQICLNTIRNQRKRHAKHKCGLTFLECLAERYCPTKGKLSKAEKQLNGNWLKNVKYFLDKAHIKE